MQNIYLSLIALESLKGLRLATKLFIIDFNSGIA